MDFGWHGAKVSDAAEAPEVYPQNAKPKLFKDFARDCSKQADLL